MQEDSHTIKKIIFNMQDRNNNMVYNERSVRKPFALKTIQLIREWRLPATPNIRHMKYPCIPPWENIEDIIRTNLSRNVTKKQSEVELRQAALETIQEKYNEYLHIYTDGSKKQNPLSTTAAYCVPSRNIERSWKLHPNITIEGAEISAIVKALEWIKILNEEPKPVVILTDSKVSLQLIKHRRPKNYEFGINSIQEHIRELYGAGWHLILQYIPSHCGVQGNHLADTLANLAHNFREILDYPLERKEIELLVEKAAKRQWDLRWQVDRRECELGSRKLLLKDWKWTRLKSRALDVAITRLRVGCCRLRSYMHSMRLADSPNCLKCPLNTEETVTHFLIECPSLNAQRNSLKRNLRNYGIVQITSDLLLGASNEDEHIKVKITNELGKFLVNSKRLEDI